MRHAAPPAGEGAALLERATAALVAAPVLADPIVSGRLRLDVAIASDPWPQGVGTVKRTLVESMH